MAFTAGDLDTLRAAYATGTLSVRFEDGRMVTYASAADLLSRIKTVQAEMDASAGVRRPSHINPTFSRGM